MNTLIFEPVAPRHNKPQRFTRALDDLTGKVVGFIDNAKPNFAYLVDDLAELLVTRYKVAKVIKHRKEAPAVAASAEVIEDLARQCDAVIAGSGD